MKVFFLHGCIACKNVSGIQSVETIIYLWFLTHVSDTGISLIESDHVTWILASYWLWVWVRLTPVNDLEQDIQTQDQS